MDVTKIFTICLVITVILLVINLLRVERFGGVDTHQTISVDEIKSLRNSVLSNLKTMPTFFTNPDDHETLLDEAKSQMETISSQSFPSLSVKNLDAKIDGIIEQEIKKLEAATESETEKSSTLRKEHPILISRYRRIEIQFDGDKSPYKIKLTANKFLEATTKPVNSVNPVNTVKYKLSSADADYNFNIIEIKDASEYLNNIDKFSNDYITIDPKIVYPFYLIQYEDDKDYCLSVNKVENETYIYLKPISGNKEEQFEIPSE